MSKSENSEILLPQMVGMCGRSWITCGEVFFLLFSYLNLWVIKNLWSALPSSVHVCVLADRAHTEQFLQTLQMIVTQAGENNTNVTYWELPVKFIPHPKLCPRIKTWTYCSVTTVNRQASWCSLTLHSQASIHLVVLMLWWEVASCNLMLMWQFQPTHTHTHSLCMGHFWALSTAKPCGLSILKSYYVAHKVCLYPK